MEEKKKVNTAPHISDKVKKDGLNPDILNKPVDIQDIVKDSAAYTMWLKLEESEWLTTKRMYEASDGSVIDLAIVHPWLKRRILHLSQKEQDEIWELKNTKYQPARLLANQWKKKAFGTIPGPGKQKSSDPKKQRAYDNALVAKFAMLVPRSAELIELFGRMFTIEEVYTVAVEDWGLPVSKKMLAEFRNHYSDIVADKINHHKRSFADLRLGIKKSRLEELCWIYAELKKDYRRTRQVKMVEQLRGVLQDIRREVEGDKMVIEGNFDINIEASVNEHLQNEVLRNISLRDLIIGRVGARVGVDPSRLIYYLTTSYYARYGGTVQAPDDSQYESIQYPNEAGYDFEMIAKNQNTLLSEAEKTKDSIPVLLSPENSSDGERLRQKLLSIALAHSNKVERDRTANSIVISPTQKE